tara:strand:- start:2978 stop:4477 length:1500 start_codon:yes stop_codon:yes gene_type:complete
MINFLKNYNKYIIPLLIIYLFINILKNILNIYTLIIFLIAAFILYKNNKKLFKKLIYKAIFKNKIYKINNKFSAAEKSLQNINEIKNLINNEVNKEIINYEKIKIEKQLKLSDYNVILFGAGSCGKTSLASALLKNIIGEISPIIGTTKKIYDYKINIPILKRNINIIDTPGLFEASIEGEEREKSTIIKAAKSDLIIFVVDQDLNKYELYLFEKLSQIGKSIIIALNKCDLRSKNQNEMIQRNIYRLIGEYSSNSKVILTSASPQTFSRHENSMRKQTFIVDNLFAEIINILDKNGEDLLADNILFQCNKLGLVSKKIINKQRQSAANKIINRYSWITSGVIFITPMPGIDLLATGVINVQMTIEISKIYGSKLTKEKASELTKSIIGVLASLGVVKGGMNLITNLLSTNFSTSFITRSLESITTAWIIKIVGLSFIKYFEQNQDWGDGGIQEVVENEYKINKREDIFKEFLNEALKKINKRNNSSSKKQLPPYSDFD